MWCGYKFQEDVDNIYKKKEIFYIFKKFMYKEKNPIYASKYSSYAHIPLPYWGLLKALYISFLLNSFFFIIKKYFHFITCATGYCAFYTSINNN